MTKKRYLNYLAIVSFVLFSSELQAQFPTKALNSKVKTIQVAPSNNQMGIPIIKLGGSEQIEIGFDILDTSDEELYYSITHCNSDWTPSDLSELEFLDGFNNNPIRDYIFSFNTYVKYVHYSLFFPNSDADLKVSGNYQIEIYKGSEKGKPLLKCCFAVVDPQVKIDGIIKSITDIDYKKHHQQLEINVDLPNYTVRNPQSESSIIVYQNRRLDNKSVISNPMINTPRRLTYSNNRNLIFEAGNTYRRFEITQFRYNGLGVQSNRFIETIFHTTLNTIELRSDRGFLYDRDQHGQYLINALHTNDVNSEADYAIVHFSFPYDTPLNIGKLYVGGAFNNYIFDDTNKMIYNFDSSSFESAQLLKQGSYNYMIYNDTNTNGKYATSKVEGNFYETPNEYLVLFYHRPFGERYDRLVGMSVLIQP